MTDRTFNVEDRIRELGEDPATAYARAQAQGMAGSAPAPTSLEDPATSAPSALAAAAATVPTVDPNDPPAALEGAPAPHDPIDDYNAAVTVKGDPRKLAMPKVDAPIQTGGIVGTQQGNLLPDAPLQPSRAPLEPDASFGELWTARNHEAFSDTAAAADAHLLKGWAPIVQALGLDPSENPGLFNKPDDQTAARVGAMRSPSRLATAAQQGEQMPFGNSWLADQPLQEQLVFNLLKQKRATDPKFLPGVPDTLAGIHQYMNDQERKADDADQAVIARSPGGLTGFAAAAGGMTQGAFRDPRNVLAIALPGGEAKSFIQIAARDALMNMAIAAANQQTVAEHKAALGEHYGVGDFVGAEIGSAVVGAGLGAALHGLKIGALATGVPQQVGAGIGAAYDTTVAKIYAAMPQNVRERWAAKMMVGNMPAAQFFGTLSNGELAQFAHDMRGGNMTLDERSAANVLERAQDVHDSSPYQPGPAGDGTHDNSLAQAVKDLEDNRTPEAGGVPSDPNADGSGAASPAAATERPPATSTAGRPQRFQISDTHTAIEQFMNRVAGPESHGNANAKNPKSSASGLLQFTDPTFRQYYRQVYGVDPGEHPAAELKNDPDVQQRLGYAFAYDNAAHLDRLGETVNPGNLYVMHLFGPGDGAKLFKADPAASIESVLGETEAARVFHGNPQFRGKSASEAIAWAHEHMGEHVASVRASAGPLEAATNDDRTPQLNDQALQLEPAVIASDAPTGGWHSPTPGEQLASTSPIAIAAGHVEPDAVPPMYARSYPSSSVLVDADRFQFKAGGDENGVTDRLKGVTQWNPLYAGRIVTWEDNQGRVFVADGHQRVGLARRLEADGHPPISLDAIALREADGVSAEDARVYAALKNIAEGTGTSIDAAKVIRDAGPHVLKHLPPKSALVRDGEALARLSDRAFGAVYNDVVPADFAAVIGHLLPHKPEAHEAMIELLAKLDPANRGQAESIVRQAIAAGIHKEEQVDLFGTHEHVTSLMLEKAKVLERVLAELRKMKLVHTTAADNAGALERAGSKIARERSAEEARANAQAIETVNRLAYRAGPIADAISNAARELKSGGKLSALARSTAERVRELDLAELDRAGAAGSDGDAGAATAGSPFAALSDASAGDDADGFSFDGAGRGGEAGEESPQLPAERGDPEQPSLHELEQATERFSDPNGQAAQQTSNSLFHDLKASVSSLALAVSDRTPEEKLNAALERSKELLESFPAADGETHAGTHNIPGDAPVPGGGTRRELRKRVVEQLLAKPARAEHIAHLILGPPAAGKSTIADPIAAKFGARIIDSDEAKAEMPEYENGVGAAAVHEESARIAEQAVQRSMRRGDNLVLPVIGKTHAGVQARIDDLAAAGYRVYVHMVDLPVDQAVDRAIARFHLDGRLVAPDYVRSVGTAPLETFNRIVDEPGSHLGGYLHVSNEVPKGELPRVVRASDDELVRGLGLDRGPGLRENAPGEGGQPQREPGGVARGDVPGEGAQGPLEPTFRIGDDGEPLTAADLLKDLEDDDKAIQAMKGCL